MASREGSVQVEVLHAGADNLWRRDVDLPAGATVLQALEASGFFNDFPDFRHPLPPVGIFGRVCSPEHELQPGDRIEIYRPLVFDPMESRRRRARHRERTRAAKTASP